MTHSKPFSKFTPIRPLQAPNGDELNYRTHIDKPEAKFKVFDPLNIACQIQLYRWTFSDNFPSFVSIADLHDYLFFSQYRAVSKRNLGTVILQAVTYNPRKTKGITIGNPIACAGYAIYDRLELRYGLEWMISMWLPKVDIEIVDRKTAEKSFNEMAACSEVDVRGLFFEPILDPSIRQNLKDYSWAELWNHPGYMWETEVERVVAPTEPRRLLRDLSRL